MAAKQAGLDVEAFMPIKETLRDLASDFNITPQDSGKVDQDELKAKKAEMMQQLQGMMTPPEQAMPGEQPV